MDKIKHFALCFFVTCVIGWTYGLAVGLAIELTQAEAGNADVKTFFKHLFSKDSLLDLLADACGIGLGIIVRSIA